MKRKIIIPLILCFILLLYVGRVIYVNANGFHLETDTYDLGEVCRDGDYKISVNDMKIFSKEEFKDKFNTNVSFYGDSNINYYIAAVELEVEYDGEKDEDRYNKVFSLISGAYCSGGTISLDNLLGSDCIIKKGEKRAIWHFSPIVDSTVTKGEWNSIKDRKWKLMIKEYPREIIMICN